MKIGDLMYSADFGFGVLLTFCSAREQWKILFTDIAEWFEEDHIEIISEGEKQ